MLLLSNTVDSLVSYCPTDVYSTSSHTCTPGASGEGDEGHGLLVEAWEDFRLGGGGAACQALSWHMPNPEEVRRRCFCVQQAPQTSISCTTKSLGKQGCRGCGPVDHGTMIPLE